MGDRGLAMSDKPTYEQLTTRIAQFEQGVAGNHETLAALRQEQAFTSAVMKTSGALVVVLDKEGRIVRFNRGCERTTGYTFDEVRGRFFWELFLTPEEVDSVKAVFSALCAGQFPNEHENFWLNKEGGRRRIMWANTALLDDAGQVSYVIGTGIDITERKHAEQALKESEDRYRRITEAVTDYIYTVIVKNGRPITTIHGSACEAVTGYTPRDFKENPFLWIQMVPDEDRQLVEEQAELLLSRVRAEPIEHRIIRKDGVECWVRNTAVPHFDGDGTLVSYEGLLKDITVEKNAERALQESEANYRLLFSAGSDAIVIVDSKTTKIVEANPAALALYGYDRDVFIGMDATALSDEPEKTKMHIEQMASGELAVFTSGPTLRMHKKKDGKTFPVEISSGVYELKNRKLVCAIIRDITERVHVEAALRQSLDELETKVKQTTTQLVMANEDLKREIEDRKQVERGMLESEEKLYDEEKRMGMLKFANEVALNLMHELRNPLVSIGGFSRRLCSGGHCDTKQKEYAQVIYEESMKLESVLDKVLVHLKEAAKQ
jgi:PAS domain S-box-containing protein